MLAENPFAGELKQQRERKRAALRYAINAVEQDEPDWFANAIHEIWLIGAARDLFLALRRTRGASADFRIEMVGFWVVYGDSIRSEVADDFVVLDGIRQILPVYDGPAKRLYRGDAAANRRRRTYGMSWSSEKSAATAFAKDRSTLYQSGAVLLEAIAPPEAIVSCIHDHDPENGEHEYILDRRRLQKVTVLERFVAP